MRGSVLFALFLAFVAVVGAFCFVIIDERELAFRTLLDQPEVEIFGVSLNEAILDEPGLYLSVPGLHELYQFDRRLQRFDSPARRSLTSEKLQIEVDYFAMWRIADPRVYFEAFRGERRKAVQRIDNISYGEVRKTIGKHTLRELLSEKREPMMQEIIASSDAELHAFGIEITDMRVRRADYPDANLAQVYDRMRSERKRFALKARAEGEEQARTIRSKAEQEADITRARAESESTRLRGEGDAEAIRIYAEAYGADPEFYAFIRSLEAYRKSLDKETTLILSKDVPFLKYLFDESNQEP